MRLLAEERNRHFLGIVTLLLILNTLALQWAHGSFSFFLLAQSLLLGALILLCCLHYFQKQNRMIDNARNQMVRFMSGQRDERIDCDKEGAIYGLFQAINTLSAISNAQAEREKQTNDFLKSMISDISHQLKTPLASLGIYNELLMEADHMEDVKRFSKASETELERIDTLVKNLLKLTRLDAGAIVFEKHPENLGEILEELKQRFACRAQLEKKEIRLSGSDELFCCDAEWLTEAFGNIIKNSLDHTSEGGLIDIAWKRNGNLLNVTFRDNGCGIRPEDLNYIFKRFYRSRFSKDTQGIGLGLALAKTIIEGHDGIIEAESRLHSGTVMNINFLIPTEL